MVQREYLGRLIYGGGDDVLAMLPVADLLPAAARLRDGWSGKTRFAPVDDHDSQRRRLKLDKGHAHLDDHLLRMMGAKATASAGLVVAHHQTPLARVLRELDDAEKRAKDVSEKDAFHLRVLKRFGGALNLTLKWEQLAVFQRLIDFLRHPSVSRPAAYHCLQWLCDLPEPEGDGRAAAVHAVEYAPTDPDYDAVVTDGRGRIVLTGPGIFPEGWRLPGMDGEGKFSLDGITGRVGCAAASSSEVVSGWDLAQGQPKPAQRAVPAGSVYWLEDLEATPDQLRELVEHGLWSDPAEDRGRRAEGFNRFSWGRWP